MRLSEGFIEQMQDLGEEMTAVVQALEAGVSVSPAIRINQSKKGVAPCGATEVGWCYGGYYLGSRPDFTHDPALHQGRYYVQDASSMAHSAAVAAAVAAVGADTPLRYLDACAAPGGKTLATVDALPDDAFVLANEYDRHRCNILIENVAKWGCGNVAVCRGDASALRVPDGFFDIIAVDAPCSGEGMMAKEEVAVTQWSPALVEQCAALQRRIVEHLWGALAPGGCLIYSTCTFNLAENEEIIAYAREELGAEVLPIAALERPEIVSAIGGYDFAAYRFLPGRVNGHGQFIALLRKDGTGGHCAVRTRSNRPSRPAIDISRYLDGDYIAVERDAIYAVRADNAPLLEALKGVDIVCPGIEAGCLKGKDFIPAQALALAVDLRADAFECCAIDTPTAVEYLKRQPLGTLSAPRGIVLLTHEGLPLGFVKNLGNRANNLYPAQWRILH